VGAREDRLAQWAENQRALARALGLTIEDWMKALDAAGARQTGVYAAVVGAAMARGLGLSIIEGLSGVEIARAARQLIDPKPPRVSSPLLAEAIRRAGELGVGAEKGAGRLRRKKVERPEPLPTPVRETKPLGESSEEATPDAPGRAKGKRRKRKASGSGEEEEG
jgi:hypothetical protein